MGHHKIKIFLDAPSIRKIFRYFLVGGSRVDSFYPYGTDHNL